MIREIIGKIARWMRPAKKEHREYLEIDDDFIASNDSFEIIEPLWWSVSIYDGFERYQNDLSRFSREQRLLFACHWYIAEVNNGGHDQFYSNSTGIVWRDAMEGFAAAGIAKVAEIISESARRLGGEPSFDREERNLVLDEISPKFDDLDTEFYSIDGDGSVEEVLTAYVRENADSFYFAGEITKPCGA